MEQDHASNSRLHFVAKVALYFVFVAASCLEPYPAPPGSENLNLLVVDGFLNSTSGLAQVKLTRSLPLNVEYGYPLEGGASVEVEDENGGTISLPETSPGIYSAISGSLQVGKRYRLKVTL